MSGDGTTAADDPPEGIALLGEEMLTWSDLEGGLGGVDGSIAVLLLDRLVPADGAARLGRALVVGPHEAALVQDVAAVADHTDVLVRSYPDAEALRAALPESVGVHCGPIGRFGRATADGDGGYDVVVALDGLDRLHSAEQDRPGWGEGAGRLGALLAPGGDLFVAVPNPVGLDRLLAVGDSSAADDAHWPEGRVERAGPVRVGQRADALAEALGGLRVVARWACFGAPRRPRLGVPVGLLESAAPDQRLGRLATAATLAEPSVTDPRAAVSAVVAAGLGSELAPQWVLHLTSRSEAASTTEAAPDVVLVAEAPADRPAVPSVVHVEGERWVREPSSAAQVETWATGARCDPARLAGPLPGGSSLQDLLARAVEAHDLVAAGELVRGYRDWLTGDGPNQDVPAERVALTFADLVQDGGPIEVADARMVAEESAPVEDVLVRTLLVAGRTLLSQGTSHPWSATASPASIARSLAAAARLEVDLALMDRAVALDHRLRPEPVDFLEAAPPAPSYAELVEQAADFRTRLTEAESQLEWLVSNIHVRQRALRASRGRVGELEGSAEYRIGKRVLPFRALAKKGRDWARERKEGPMHEWRAKPKQRDPIPVDPDLLPKGYQPKGDEV